MTYKHLSNQNGRCFYCRNFVMKILNCVLILRAILIGVVVLNLFKMWERGQHFQIGGLDGNFQ